MVIFGDISPRARRRLLGGADRKLVGYMGVKEEECGEDRHAW